MCDCGKDHGSAETGTHPAKLTAWGLPALQVAPPKPFVTFFFFTWNTDRRDVTISSAHLTILTNVFMCFFFIVLFFFFCFSPLLWKNTFFSMIPVQKLIKNLRLCVVVKETCVYVAEGTTWSTDSTNRTSSWLVLRNLTPQVRYKLLLTQALKPLCCFYSRLTEIILTLSLKYFSIHGLYSVAG